MFKFLKYFLFLCQLTSSLLVANVPKLLPDGIFVMSAGDVVTSSASWTVLVTIDAPKINPSFINRLKRSDIKIKEIFRNYNLTNPLDREWTEMMNALSLGKTEHKISQLRSKRGLINFVGSIAHTLFGLVTETELNELTSVVSNLENSTSTVVHTVNDMITAINHTADHVNENGAHIFALQQATNTLYTVIDDIGNRLKQHDSMIATMQVEAKISQTFQKLHFLYESWMRAIDKYQRQRENLESGQLTEDILKPNDLDKILRQGRELGFDTLPDEWYYSHLSIEPIWEKGERLVFRATIPFIDTVRYLRYVIQTYPIKGMLPNTTIQVLAVPDVAMNTRSGEIFYPEDCLGFNPMVCKPSALYSDDRLDCPRGIINGHTDLRESCEIRVVSVHNPRTNIHRLFDIIHIVVSSGEFYLVHCSNQPEQRLELTPGAYRLTVKKHCTVSGNGWLINGMLTRKSQVQYNILPLDIVPFNLPNLTLTPVVALHANPAPEWGTFSPPLSIKIKHLNDIPFNKFTWGSHSAHVAWIALIIGMVLFSIILIVCLYKYKGRIRRKLCGKSVHREGHIGKTSSESVQPSAPFQLRAPSFRLPCIYPNVAPCLKSTNESSTNTDPAV